MPTYEYQCKKCGAVMEVFQPITAPAKKTLECETCARRVPVVRLIGTGGGVIFKGSGFYETDYRSKSYREAAKADLAPAAGDSGKSCDSSSQSDTGAKTKPVEKPKANKSGKATAGSTST